MRAYHFLKDDMTAGSGNEPAWVEGEERTYDGPVALCQSGYHSSPSWYDTMKYAPGYMACIVEVSTPIASDKTKAVSQTRKLITAHNARSVLIRWACDCAERALLREREAGREPNIHSWKAVEVARKYAQGDFDVNAVNAAHAAALTATTNVYAIVAAADAATYVYAAYAAAVYAAHAAAAYAAAIYAAAAYAAAAYAATAAYNAARSTAVINAEIEWQRKHLDEMMSVLFTNA